MKRFLNIIDGFFFREVSASGFGLMRIAWAVVVIVFMVMNITNITRFYSSEGLIPYELGDLVFRSEYRFTVLNTITSPQGVFYVYLLLLLAATCTLIGLWPRVMTTIAVLLLFSFHERNLQPLGGGDTVLRNVGFLLVIAPELRAFSYERLREQWVRFREHRKLLPPLRTHIWPYRLLLWQMIIIYITSLWDKLQGTMWKNGTAIGSVLHHPHFATFPRAFNDRFAALSPFLSTYTLIFEGAWLLMLIPESSYQRILPFFRKHSLKRWLLIGGVLFHGGIGLLMDVGSFSFAMTAAYLGLLLDEDFQALRSFWNFGWKGSVKLLYDSHCRLCTRSAFLLKMSDHLHRMKLIDFRDPVQRKATAPDVTAKELDRSVHLKLRDGRYLKGFDAFRYLTWQLPILRIVTPLLWLPGVAPIGRKVYARIAAAREKCADGVCVHTD